MKPQQLIFDVAALGHAIDSHVRCARRSFPTITAVAVAIASTVVLTLGGCASSAGIASKAQPIEAARVGIEPAAAPAPVVEADWWRAFGDAQLDTIVARALADAPGLKVAQARLERAQAAVAGVESADGVQVNAKVDATRQRFSATSIYPAPLGGSIRTLANAQVGASYEFDFFGRNRSAIEAAVGVQRAAQADAQAARIVLASNVARTYVQLGRLFAQREVAARALEQRNETLALIRQRVSGGLDTNVELRQGEGALPESRQQIEQLDEQIALARHALAALVAAPPDAYDALVVPLRTVRAVQVPELLPADLLGRRAEIAAARWRIEAATSDVASAKAGFYPNVNLSAFVGFSSIGLDQLAKAASRQFGIGPAITLPIFDSGRLRANLRGKAADLDAAIESYNGAVLDAVHDTADQLASVRSIERQQQQQASAQAAAESAYDLATQRYKAGLATYLVVLNAEAGVLNQRRLGVDLKARALDVQIALIRALGGGYADDRQSRGETAEAPSTNAQTAAAGQ
jgi:NodT family efflux transporter outer membrane factor (OMF) lipoprotein